ncbi:inner membrane CreD family protein (plasmid) [Xanthomonas axonopodis pv. vasculorum]
MKSLTLLLRFATIGGLILLLLIPLLLIRGAVQDRARYRDEAVERVAQSKAGEQQFIAPVRVLPYTEEVQVTEPDEQGNQRKVWRKRGGTLLQTPRRLTLSGEMVPSVREVGLYRVQVYSWKATLHAEYDPFDYAAAPSRVYGQPYLAIGISDVRGLVGTPRLQVDGRTLALESGAGALADRSAGIHAQLGPLADQVAGRLQDGNMVDMQLVLDGTRRLAIAPIADNNDIALRSAWQHPSFGGRFLPTAPSIGPKGFDASWSLSSLANGAQTQLQSSHAALDMLEVRRSENIAFWQAYLVSAAACIGLQFFYLSGVLRSWVRAAGFSVMLTALYAVLYSLLISEDNALLMGALLLLGILASIMWVTRKLDWDGLGNSLR